MGHVPKSKYVGNHGGAYTDLDGHSKQFTYIDMDKKTKISRNKMSDKEKDELKEELKQQVTRSINEILALPAVNLIKNTTTDFFDKFIIRDREKGIIWHETALREACEVNDILRHNISVSVWKNTVKPQYWFEEMSHEDILEGKWKEWI